MQLSFVKTNRLLQAMSADTRSRIVPWLERVALPLGAVISEPDVATDHLYFPIDCIVSLINLTSEHHCAEVSVVGNEGVVGMALFMGGDHSASRAVVQAAGSAWRIPSALVDSEFQRHGEFMALMLRYTQALMAQIAQTAVCNRHHTIDQQLGRWLLHSLDRIQGNSLQMTQGLIANMLGVRREGVTEAAGKLQARGAIAYRRGHIDVLDRRLLERLSCECYGVVRREYDRLFPAPPTEPNRLPARIDIPLPDVQRPPLVARRKG